MANSDRISKNTLSSNKWEHTSVLDHIEPMFSNM
jgi:hypothetical protein